MVLNRYLIATGRSEDLDALGALPLFLVAARGDPRQGDGGAAAARRARGARGDRGERAQIFRLRLHAPSRRRRRCSWPSAAFPAPASRSSRARWRRIWLRPRARCCCAPTSSARLLLGRSEQDKLPAEAYTPAVTARVYATIADKARRAVAAGHSAIVDAVFAKPAERALIRQSAQALGARCHLLFLEAPLDVRLARVGTRTGDASDADAAIARAQAAYDLGTMDWTRIDASGTPDETLARALRTL